MFTLTRTCRVQTSRRVILLNSRLGLSWKKAERLHGKRRVTCRQMMVTARLLRVDGMAIQSFSDKSTERFFTTGELGKGIGWASVSKIARRKLYFKSNTLQILAQYSPGFLLKSTGLPSILTTAFRKSSFKEFSIVFASLSCSPARNQAGSSNEACSL